MAKVRAYKIAEELGIERAEFVEKARAVGVELKSAMASVDDEEAALLREKLGAKATVVRPTYIVGPGDTTDRFTYWVERLALGGEVLGPPEPSSELQWVDARDLCPWIIDLIERDQPGVFNAAGPAVPMSWEQVLGGLARGSEKPVKLRWATRDVLERSGMRLPLVRATAGSAHFSGEAAQAVGLRYRPLADTAAATLAWWRSQPAERRAAAEG